MTEGEWAECNDPGKMLGFVHRLASGRKLRLLSVACFGGGDASSSDYRNALEAVERFADGLLTETECDAVLADEAPLVATFVSAERLLEAATSTERWKAACDGASQAGIAAKSLDRLLWHYTQPHYSAWIREVFGNPFRPIVVAPDWLTGDVIGLATGIYQDRAFDRLPILADALMDAGCDNEDILRHCRGDGPHVRGCWVLDLLLGKQ